MARKPLFQEEKKKKAKASINTQDTDPAGLKALKKIYKDSPPALVKSISKMDKLEKFQVEKTPQEQEDLAKVKARRDKKMVAEGEAKKKPEKLWISDAPQIVDPFGQQGIDIKKDLTKPEQKAVQKNIEKVVKEQGEDPKEFKQRAKKGELSSGFVNILSQGLGLLVGGAVGGSSGAAEGHSQVVAEQQRQLDQANIEEQRALEVQKMEQTATSQQATRENQLNIAKIRQQAALAKVTIKSEKERQELVVPFGDQIMHATNKDDAKIIKKAVSAYQNLERELDKAIALRTDYGREIFSTGSDQATNEQTISNLVGILKSEEFINLGVLTGPDLELVEQQIGNDLTHPLQGTEFVVKKLNEVRASMKGKLDAQLATRTVEGISQAKARAELKRRKGLK